MDEFLRKTNEIAQQASQTTDPTAKTELKYQMIDAAIDLWNESIAGQIEFANGNTATIMTL